jgi:hypothetical protein
MNQKLSEKEKHMTEYVSVEKLREVLTSSPKFLIQRQEGWECFICDMPLMECSHYHGEWQCQDCGDWTYPVYYDFEDGC